MIYRIIKTTNGYPIEWANQRGGQSSWVFTSDYTKKEKYKYHTGSAGGVERGFLNTHSEVLSLKEGNLTLQEYNYIKDLFVSSDVEITIDNENHSCSLVDFGREVDSERKSYNVKFEIKLSEKNYVV
jgi:hypothetical protein